MTPPTITREELYEKVWTTPMVALAEEFGISDVALAKRCRRWNIPCPPRGYWAKLAAGRNPQRGQLPPGPEPVEKMPRNPQDPSDSVGAAYSFPKDGKRLHPAAQNFQQLLRGTTEGSDRRLSINSYLAPITHISAPLIAQAVKSLHVLVMVAEANGIEYTIPRSRQEHPHFSRSGHRLLLEIEEPILTVRREPTAQDKRRPSWEWKTSSQELSGRLKFSLRPYYRDTGTVQQWIQTDKEPPETVVAKVLNGILEHFDQHDREQEEARQRTANWVEERKQQESLRQAQQHAATLAAIADQRSLNLIKAAEWWRISQATDSFIEVCEARWREAGAGELSAAQTDWLTWAKLQSARILPWELSYPDPSRDGGFAGDEIPLGGPYPEVREIPFPPTMPPPEVSRPAQTHFTSPPSPSPYPFWLKHPHR